MIKLIVKVAIAGLVANASWQVGSAYLNFYRFKDAVTESAQFSSRLTEDQLRQRVLELATQFDVDIGEERLTVRRQSEHTYVDGSYTRVIEPFPGFRRPWQFQLHVDTINFNEPLR